MKSFKTLKNCPCRKDDRCVNGLECSEKHCFLQNGKRPETMIVASAWGRYDSLAIASMTARESVQLR